MAITKKPAAKKPAAKKPAAKKPTAKKAPSAKKPAAPKPRTKKPAPANKAAAAKPKVKRTPNAAFMKAMMPSEMLARIVGALPIPRTEVVKKMWQYIKKNRLRTPSTSA
jgi:upstream activation factor subunit UAF30